MCPSIDIDDEVWSELQRRAVPLVDNPNTVLRRALDLTASDAPATTGAAGGKAAAAGRRARPGELLPESEYEMPILRALVDGGGYGVTREILDAVGEALADRLQPLDREPSGNGNERKWEARAHFTRLRLIERNLMKKSARRGIWEISDEGRARVQAEDTASSPSQGQTS